MKRTKEYYELAFIEKANRVHNGKYTYENCNYTNKFGKVKVTCPIHGEFYPIAREHTMPSMLIGCIGCHNDSKRWTKEKFVERAITKHGDKYTYEKVDYYNAKSRVIITCPMHGDFEQTAGSHIAGYGCATCGAELGCGYNKSRYVEIANKKYNGIAKLYIIRCFNYYEEFYKIGITMTTLKKRFKGKEEMPYDYEIIKIIEDEVGTIFDLEKELHKKYKSKSYKPNIFFQGHLECFKDINFS